ncbi:MAG: hypothetical protein Q8R63_10035 [Ramlibacter sp.]|nr:hypothetical protein [Ramlibacter sp.]
MSDASDKLARTRLAIIEHVHRKKHPEDYDRQGVKKAGERRPLPSYEQGEPEPAAYEPGISGRTAQARRWLTSGQRVIGAWWRHHPAHLGVELATPMLSSFAGRRPVVYLGTAALLGAVIVVARPWRLISATGLIVAILKSSQLSSMVMSAMSAASYGRGGPPYDDGRPYE